MFFQQVEARDIFGFEMFNPIGPFPHDYNSGMHSTIGMLWQSQKVGCHEEKQKYSSVHKVRSLHTNFDNASVRGAVNNLVLPSAKTRMITMMAPSDSEWHTRFMASFHARVGE